MTHKITDTDTEITPFSTSSWDQKLITIISIEKFNNYLGENKLTFVEP